jgi:hypothetical protein
MWNYGNEITFWNNCSVLSRGFQLSKLDGIQIETDRYLKKILFTLSKIFEKVSFFEDMYLSFLKNANMTPNSPPPPPTQKTDVGYQKRWIQIRWYGFRKMFLKKYRQKTLQKLPYPNIFSA